MHDLSGVTEDFLFHGLPYPDLPHFSAFSWEACDAAYRDEDASHRPRRPWTSTTVRSVR